MITISGPGAILLLIVVVAISCIVIHFFITAMLEITFAVLQVIKDGREHKG